MKRGISDKNLVFSNFSFNENKTYMMFIGGSFKHHLVCKFFAKPMKEYYGKNVETIYVFNNFPPPYFKGRYIVISSNLKRLMSGGKEKYFFWLHHNLNEEASNSKHIRNLIRKILKNQKDLFLCLYKDNLGMTLQSEFKNVKLIGPKTKIFDFFDNKSRQHHLTDSLKIPQPRWFLASDRKDLLRIYSKKFNDGRAFVSKIYSYGGFGSAIVESKKELLNNPNIKSKNSKYVISKLIDVLASPSSEALVANKDEVFFMGILDQIMKGQSYAGSIYPTKLKRDAQKKIEEYTIRIGKYLGGKGYVGFFSIDWIVDSKYKIYFSEINPRMGASTLERIFMHEKTKPKGVSSLPELEFMAVTKGTFGNLKLDRIRDGKFSWGLFHVEVEKGTVTTGNLLPKFSESEVFNKFETTILDFPGKNIHFGNESRLCRIISVKSSREEVEKELIKHINLALKQVRG